MKTNDLKKDDRVQLRNGWYATIEDNTRGNTRLATVEGHVTEMGSVYSHNIIRYKLKLSRIGGTDTWKAIEHTPSQIKMRKMVESRVI